MSSDSLPVTVQFESSEDAVLSKKARNKAEAMALFAKALLALKKEQKFTPEIVNTLLNIIKKDPGAITPLQLILASWSTNNGSYYKISLKELVPLSRKHPEKLKLNIITVLGLTKTKRYDEAISLLRNVLDTNSFENIPETKHKLFIDIVITLVNLYEQQKLYDKGDSLLCQYINIAEFKESFFFQNAAVFFYLDASEHSDNKTFFWFSEGDKDRFTRKMKEHLNKIPGLSLQKIKLTDMASLLELCHHLKKLDIAKKLILDFLLSQPDNNDAMLLLATVYRDLKEYGLAYRAWRQLVKNQKSNAEYYLRLGNTAMLAQRYSDAVRAYEWYLVFKPENRLVLYQLAFAYFEREEYHKAINKLNKLGGNPDALFLAALAYKRIGDYKRALSYIAKAAKNAKNSRQNRILGKSFYLTYALIAERAGNLGEVENILNKLLKKTANDPEVENFLGYILADHNLQLDRAEKLIRSALSKRPGNSAFLDSLAWVLYRQGKYLEAVRYIKKSLQNAPGGTPDPVIIDHAGDIYLKTGNVTKALQYWKTALSIYSKDLNGEKVFRKIKKYSPK